jgi:hydroxyethylthiazole kinase
MLDAAVVILEKIRSQSPLVHCLTNHVVKDITANVMLSLGAAPAMIEDAGEAEEFAAIAQALLINLGTLSIPQTEAMRNAIAAANKANRLWVLDPVAVGAVGLRTRFAAEILNQHPALIRGNASEILALAGIDGGGRGVESGRESSAALDAARQLSLRTDAVVLVTGSTDFIVSEDGSVSVHNGDAMMTRVTGIGCAMGAVCAAALAVSTKPDNAAVATALIFGVAGEIAAAKAKGPGSFAVEFLDTLYTLDADTLRKYGKIS